MTEQYSAAATMQTPNGKRQHAPASQQRRNGSTRKAHLPPDGSLSDGALLSSVAASPRSRKTQRHRNGLVDGTYNQNTEYTSSATRAPKPRTTSNVTGALPTGAKEDLRYAGATFSASPAASNLPVPKFAARSASNTGGAPSFTKQQSKHSPPEVFDSSPEATPASPVHMPNSPLDMLFRADRAERARSVNVHNGMQFGSPLNSKSMLLNEVNGENGVSSPSRPTSLGGRPVLGDRTHSSPGAGLQTIDDEDERQAITRSLKSLLFNQGPAHEGSPPPAFGLGNAPPVRTPERNAHGPTPYHNLGTPTPQSEQRSQNSYHYGNRNLSPLLQAARGDASGTFAGMNQVMGSGHENPPFYPTSSTAPRQPEPQYGQFSRHYPSEQLRGHEIPRAPFSSHQPPNGNTFAGAQQQNVFLNHYVEPSTGSPKPGAPRDTSAMENDLRRILKLS